MVACLHVCMVVCSRGRGGAGVGIGEGPRRARKGLTNVPDGPPPPPSPPPGRSPVRAKDGSREIESGIL